jgi:hypothetical protein
LTKNLRFGLVWSRNLDKNAFTAEKTSFKQGLPVKKKMFTAACFILLFLIATATSGFFKLAQANPYMYHELASPPPDATPLVISVSSPKNNTICRVNDIVLTLNISTYNTSIGYLLNAYFKANWMQNNVTIYEQNIRSPEFPKLWDYSKTFRDMPDGQYSIIINARGGGGYARELTYYFFDMTTISMINFSIDTTPPKVSIKTPLNGTYESLDVPLNFTVSEKPSLIRYSLDGQKNLTLYRNTTFTNLHYGRHNVTVYVWDVAGNAGNPETVIFNIAEPEPETFPATLVIASLITGTVEAIGLLIYFKKRKG